MCGIFAIFGNACNNPECQQQQSANGFNGESKMIKTTNEFPGETLREMAYRCSTKQRHRGPDKTGIIEFKEENSVMVHERLRIIGVAHGDQPLQNDNGNITLIANGEIYNFIKLSNELSAFYKKPYEPRSDCDVIIGLYEKYGDDLVHHLTGMYAFVLYDRKNNKTLAARCPFGIISMYIGEDVHGNIWIASEMKCLVEKCPYVQNFPIGSLFSHQLGTSNKWKFIKYFKEDWITKVPQLKVDLVHFRETLESAVRSHLQCEVSFGALLSGGVDSSLISSIATKIMREKNPNFKLQTFSVGLTGAPDFKYSQIVADYIGSEHHEIHFTVEEGLDCIRDIIYHLETYDITTIRASIPMYIMMRYIKSRGLKMVLSGEGADEILGGYLYFHSAPNAEEFHYETVSRVLHLWSNDCLRANKSSLAWGVELRVPFLDTNFVNYSMSVRPEDRMISTDEKKIEKFILRKAFSMNYLPDEVLWRQKEQFSDGVGYNWIDTIRTYASSHINDDEFEKAKELYPFNTPLSKEGFYYRKIFERIFPNQSCVKTVKQWIPRQDWGCALDPSGRAQLVHVASKKINE
ncbi:hypothetical protein PVAND_009238 [Polypedilum vanderplanki]|uniref:Asparagine synthetase [glutamine-hydrolyzing] n=1 Tax=Polypedilum vanderplanki TaxID=319348 RepID=A0A9J6CCN4_POLVA|nr:hypothetical protein PVAND_009238 [Polypedilum vanderplanki]